MFNLGGCTTSSFSFFSPHFRFQVSLQYEPKATAGRLPSARGYHCANLADSRLFVFGGFDGHAVFDDVFVLDLAGAAYLPQVTSFRIDV
jgi:Rab9 effector protein with kelch motifs